MGSFVVESVAGDFSCVTPHFSAADALVLIFASCLLMASDTIRIRPISQPPAIQNTADLESLGPASLSPSVGADFWLLGDSGSVYLVARLSDSTPAWNDRLIVALDMNGDGGTTPQHDDFEWDFHRLMDSSVVYRGRDGRWQAPRGDPDWRLGRDRDGGGWKVREKEIQGGWLLLMTLDREFLTQSARNTPGLGFSWYDESGRRWQGWPVPVPGRRAIEQPDHPFWWGTVLR